MAMVLRRTDNGIVADEPFVLTCGCGSVVPDVRSKLNAAGVGDVPMLNSPSNDTAKGYMRQIGLDKLEPSLTQNKHAILYNPHTGQWVNMLNTGLNQKVLNNIYKVARGITE